MKNIVQKRDLSYNKTLEESIVKAINYNSLLCLL